ncbi:hypothetical protein C3486_00045 [Streptomyces sp. Ru73]|nr:hypothetical protein C3486_00045 [Streptomyces sp. Ru73]
MVALFTRATGHVPPEHVSVATVHNNTRWTARLLPDLINEVTSSPNYDDREPWDNLEFKAADPAGRVEVQIGVTRKTVTVRVSGTDDILVYGQQARIELFLKNRGAKSKDETGRAFDWQVTLFMPWLAFVGFAALTETPPNLPPVPVLAKLIASLMCVMGVVYFVKYSLKLYRDRPRLVILNDIPSGWNHYTPSEKIAVVGVYVAVLGAVAAAVSAVSDVL